VIQFGKAYPDALNPGVDGLPTTLEALVAGHGPADDQASGR
jgi:hypothetical protein